MNEPINKGGMSDILSNMVSFVKSQIIIEKEWTEIIHGLSPSQDPIDIGVDLNNYSEVEVIFYQNSTRTQICETYTVPTRIIENKHFIGYDKFGQTLTKLCDVVFPSSTTILMPQGGYNSGVIDIYAR